MNRKLLKSYLLVSWCTVAVIFVINLQVSIAATQEVSFKSDGFILSGALSIPDNSTLKIHPAAVLVPGSGVSDRDETVAINDVVIKPFKELAEALEKAGFVVLRYDKRNFTMKQQGATLTDFDKITPDTFIKDAKAAIDFIETQPQVDPLKIILIGYSEGATFSPEIADNKKLAGMVLIAPGLLHFRDGVVYQIKYQIKVYERENYLGRFDREVAKMKSILKELEDIFALIDSGKFPTGGYILGANLAYYQRMQELTEDVVTRIRTMPMPVLIINGTKDMLCPVEILKSKEEELERKSDLSVEYFNDMTHQLYNSTSGKFEYRIVERIINWSKILPNFTQNRYIKSVSDINNTLLRK